MPQALTSSGDPAAADPSVERRKSHVRNSVWCRGPPRCEICVCFRDCAFGDRGIRFDDAVLQVMIREYTYEAGVRNLEREIANVFRKIARRIAEEKPYPKRIRADNLLKYLGPPRIPGPAGRGEDGQ